MITRNPELVRLTDRIAIATGGVESGSVSAEGTIVNWVRGLVRSQYSGLVRSGVRVKVGTRTDLHIRWTQQEDRPFIVGQAVVAMMSAGALRVEHGMFRRSKQRWNRWLGRIVLIERVEARVLYTVKVHAEEWTLKSFGPVLGAQRASQPWDDVNIVIDPQEVELSIAAPCYIVRQS